MLIEVAVSVLLASSWLRMFVLGIVGTLRYLMLLLAIVHARMDGLEELLEHVCLDAQLDSCGMDQTASALMVRPDTEYASNAQWELSPTP